MKFQFDIDPIVPGDPKKLAAQLNKQRQRIQDVGRSLDAVPFLDGVLRKGISIAGSSTTVVNHKLGRVPTGWIVTRKQIAAPDFFETARSQSSISFEATTACTVDIWFF